MYVQQGYVFGLVCLYVIKKWLFGVFAKQKISYLLLGRQV